IPLQTRLASVRIPLRKKDPDICLDLQSVFDLAYRKGRYYANINYREAPEPPLKVRRGLGRSIAAAGAQALNHRLVILSWTLDGLLRMARVMWTIALSLAGIVASRLIVCLSSSFARIAEPTFLVRISFWAAVLFFSR